MSKESKFFRRVLLLFLLVMLIGVLYIFIDGEWLKKTLAVILIIVGFIGSVQGIEYYKSKE
ncbi:hypothetical protein FZC66_05530 [Priestia megaterium]|nr:hypothetical protein FZC66_05530 [Priestia megaterium]